MSPSLQAQPKAKLPWSLVCICWMCMLSCVVPAAVVWGINNRRLGISPPLRTRIFVWASLALYGLVQVRLLLVDEENLQRHLQLVGFAMALILSWQFYVSQRVAFARYYNKGLRTAALKLPIVLGFVWMCVVATLQLGAYSVHTERDYKQFVVMASNVDKGDFKGHEAELFFQKFKSKYPEETSAHWNLAIIYAQTDRFEEARAEMRDLLELEPDNKEAREYLRELEGY
ncbi:tetratricopeptide repeat protein [bacterium]|nr:MAG: tetratricopeptide repeat protein [bacterium]